MLGLEGCNGRPGDRPVWYQSGIDLEAGSGIVGDPPCPGIINRTYEDAQAWAYQPELLIQDVDDDGFATPDSQHRAWFPSYKLLFRTSFAFNEANGHGPVAVVGRATVELGELSETRLQDEQLGESGLVYLVDDQGWILSSQKPGEILEVRGQGQMRFRRIWDLSHSWTPTVKKAFPASGGVRELYELSGETRLLGIAAQAALVAVTPLPAPYQRFAVVVVADKQDPFTDSWLWRASMASFFTAAVPYEALIIGGVAIFFHQWLLFFKDQQGAGKDKRGSHVEGMSFGEGLHEYGKSGYRQTVANMAQGLVTRMRGSFVRNIRRTRAPSTAETRPSQAN
jgi:hypothetical protein